MVTRSDAAGCRVYHAGGEDLGLAAMQVGDLRAVVIVDVGRRVREDEASTLLEMVNPVVVEQSGGIVWREGCLSVPGVFEDVRRAERILVEARDEAGGVRTIEAEGLLAVCIQHEMDHLRGRVFVEHLSRLKQSRIRSKLEKESRRKAA
jgi:peptide deformylase